MLRNLLVFLVCSFSALAVADSRESLRDYYRSVGRGYTREAQLYRASMPSFYYVTPVDGYYGLARKRRDSDYLWKCYDRANLYYARANELDYEIARDKLTAELAKAYAERQHITVTLSPAIEDATLVVNGHIISGTKGVSRPIVIYIGAGKSSDVTVAIEIVRQGKRYTSPTKTAKDIAAGAAPTFVAFTELDFQKE